MKKIISFSLFGGDPKYTIGAICNAELAKIIYPDWVCRFYYGHSVPIHIIDTLKTYDNVELVNMPENNENTYMSWRFLAYDDSEVEVMLSRDADSRLSFREKKLVDMFLESDFVFHDIRDHSLHGHTMGGTWGMKRGAIESMSKLLSEHPKSSGNNYGHDQDFMRYVVFKLVQERTMVHSYHNNPNFPIKDGEVISELSSAVNEQHRHFIGEIFPSDNYHKPYNHIFY
jgi:hypothetical protein